MKSIIITVCWFCFVLPTFECARILGVFTVEAKSHFEFHQSIMKSLLDSGHHITVVAPFRPQKHHQNLTHIHSRVKNRDSNPFTACAHPDYSWYSILMKSIEVRGEDCRHAMSMEEVKNIENVDVMFVETAPMWQCYLPLAKKFGIPVIGTTAHRFLFTGDTVIGNSRLPSILSAEGYYMEPKMNYFERLSNIFYEIETYAILYTEKQRMKKLYKDLFGSQDVNTDKISLAFINNHASLMPRIFGPNAINIGGINVKSTLLNPLPQYLETFLDEAQEGAILFSLGTVTNDEAVLKPNLKIFLQAFRKLPHRIVWKLDDEIGGLPNNVLISKWVPQKKILAHKNVVAFISHCGANSMYEAIYFGKPLVLMPIFGDQPANAALLNSLKVGKFLDIRKVTEEKLTSTINEVINNTRYLERMKELSQKFRDDPMSPEDSVVYWTEYVIKHRGAPHLTFSGSDMPVYQYYFIDLIVFIAISFMSLLFVAVFFLKLILSSRNCTNSEMKK